MLTTSSRESRVVIGWALRVGPRLLRSLPPWVDRIRLCHRRRVNSTGRDFRCVQGNVGNDFFAGTVLWRVRRTNRGAAESFMSAQALQNFWV